MSSLPESCPVFQRRICTGLQEPWRKPAVFPLPLFFTIPPIQQTIHINQLSSPVTSRDNNHPGLVECCCSKQLCQAVRQARKTNLTSYHVTLASLATSISVSGGNESGFPRSLIAEVWWGRRRSVGFLGIEPCMTLSSMRPVEAGGREFTHLPAFLLE